MKRNCELRVAWVIPITCIYWQAILKDFVRLFPQTKIFTSKLFISAWEWEKNLNIEQVGQLKTFKFKRQNISYGSKFALMSPQIINRLWQYRPQLIIVDTFCVWTILVLLTKFWGKWQVILAYEGSSPGVDFLNSPLRLLIRRLMVALADACITNSKTGKAYLIQILHASENKVFNYPYLVPDSQYLIKNFNEVQSVLKNTSNFQRTLDFSSNLAVNNTSPKQTVFLFIGRLIPRKGIQILLQACSLLKQQGYTNYSLIVVGEGEQKSQLQEFCQVNKLEEYIQWIGQVNYDQIGTYFEQADILVLPCLEDTWGMVILEAILYGKMVLCSNGAGASEIVADNQNGYVFEPNDPELLAKLMAAAIKDSSLIESMQQKSKQIADKYSPQLSAHFLAEIIHFCWVDEND